MVTKSIQTARVWLRQKCILAGTVILLTIPGAIAHPPTVSFPAPDQPGILHHERHSGWNPDTIWEQPFQEGKLLILIEGGQIFRDSFSRELPDPIASHLDGVSLGVQYVQDLVYPQAGLRNVRWIGRSAEGGYERYPARLQPVSFHKQLPGIYLNPDNVPVPCECDSYPGFGANNLLWINTWETGEAGMPSDRFRYSIMFRKGAPIH